MSKDFKSWIRGNIPHAVKKFVSYSEEIEYGRLSFSQLGEDMILRNFFNDKTNGFYIDVGAHHPMRYSNTYYFYKRGWRGIAIDALPGFKKRFSEVRPEDILLEIGISDVPGKIDYFSFHEPLENTFSKTKAENIDQRLNPLKEIVQIDVFPLAQVLDKYLPANTTIDFLSVDVEGYDLMVLKSNNWSKYTPSIIVIENLDVDIDGMDKDPIVLYLLSLNYQLKAFFKSALFFERL